jgi:glycerol-3-phosphate acyltransferase PlsY
MVWITYIAIFLLGSIPTAYLVGKLGHGIDIRERGSGNVGTMNTLAVLGWPEALLVFGLDIVKGVLAVCVANAAGIDPFLAAFLAVTGHIYPIWLGFRGGKGLATALGGVLAAGSMLSIIVFAVVWCLAYPVFKQVDRANIAGALAVAAYSIIVGPNWWLLLLTVIIMIKHFHTIMVSK